MEVFCGTIEREEFWDRFEAGESQRSTSRRLDRPPSTIMARLVFSDWKRPVPAGEWGSLRLSLGEGEEISRGISGGESLRGIARRLGRSASTVSREVVRNGGCLKYRGVAAHRRRVVVRIMRSR